MKYQIFIILILFLINLGTANALDTEIWTSFEDEKTGLIGFKDSDQNIKIKPKFAFTDAIKFKNIIAVFGQIDKNNYQGYYLLKNGKKVGIDSLYMWGNYFDCESEEKIRFRDKATDKVGFFDKDGKITIPAVYSDALPFRNNMSIMLKNAERVCPDGTKYSEKSKCEHWSWKGGQSNLINTNNEILIENFEYTTDLDWFSLKILNAADNNPLRDSFKGKNGKYYSFVNFKKEFTNWFKSVFIKSSNLKALKENCFTEITFWSESSSEWISSGTDDFLKKNETLLFKQINDFKQDKLDYAVLKNSLNPYIFEKDRYSKYFDYCGNAKKHLYPIFNVVVTYKNAESDYQNHFEFLRTDDGYKLISLSLKGEELGNPR